MKRTWTADELLEHFTLLPDELIAVGNKSGATRLGFAVLLKCLRYEGRFPRSRVEVAPEVVRFLAVQVGVDAALFAQYDWEGRTIEAHRAQIRGMSKMREFRRTDEEALLDWLCTEIFHYEHHPDRLRDLIRAECRTRAIEAPDDIAALIDTGLVAYEAQIYTVIVARLSADMQNRLDALLIAEPDAEEEEELPLSLMRRDPGPVGVESAMSEIAKLQSLRAIGLPPDLFEGYTPKLVERLRRRIAAESPSHIREHPHAIRLTLLAALVFQRTQEVTERLCAKASGAILCQPPEHDADHGHVNPGFFTAGEQLIIFGEPTPRGEPGEGSLHNPAPFEHVEATGADLLPIDDGVLWCPDAALAAKGDAPQPPPPSRMSPSPTRVLPPFLYALSAQISLSRGKQPLSGFKRCFPPS